MMRAVDVIRKFARNARPEYIAAWDAGDAQLEEHGIDRPLRLAHLIAQCSAECGAFTITREVMHYTHEDRLVHVFNSIRHSVALFPGEARVLLGQDRDLGERFYGPGGPSDLYAQHGINNGKNPGNANKAAGLGNHRPGDGFLFRGNGMLQTTGGDAHKRAGDEVGVDFFSHPELVTSAEHALKPVLFEWTSTHCNDFADHDDVLRISKAINLGNPNSPATPLGLEDRRHFLKVAKDILEI